jgi:cyclopropane fatty-acyl-phospholipid synthase-like methyltransferase
MEVIAVAGYGALSDVYEWLIGDDKLTPAKAAAVYYSDVVGSLPPNARVLDCACGTGQLAVGLASLGLDVVAADASDGMVRRTEKVASEHGVSLRALRASWASCPTTWRTPRSIWCSASATPSGTPRARPGA